MVRGRTVYASAPFEALNLFWHNDLRANKCFAILPVRRRGRLEHLIRDRGTALLGGHMRRHRTPPDRRAARLLTLGTTRQAPDGRTPHASAGVVALARVVGTHSLAALPGGSQAAAALLRDAVRLLCNEARATDPVRAERLLIALRPAWRELPGVRRLADDARRALWDHVVALCVAEFYAPTPAPRLATAASSAA